MVFKTFDPVPERPNFPQEEERVLGIWRDTDAFQTSYRESVAEGRPRYTFYDGPPFATGMPHYGHILAGTIKDIVTRYAHQTGFCVERRFGWDCHGLPVECEIDKALNITSRKDIQEKIGIAQYNEQCRSIVMRYASEWRTVVERMGRWIDFDNDYKTLDTSYMESIWWVFQQLYNKGFVYRAFKVMPYSTACTTPLSNFEANQNYKDVRDPSIVITFPSREDASVEFLAWTTTPWTLPANCALCVNPTLQYVRVRRIAKDNAESKQWILAETRVPWLAAQLKLTVGTDLLIEGDPVTGASLAGHRYVPPFEFYFAPKKGSPHEGLRETAFRIVADGYTSDETGTGIVHCAPAFGEDDYRVCLENKVIAKEDSGALPCPVDDDGLLTSEVGEFSGLYVKDADKVIKEHLKKKGRLLVNSDFVHAYPHCWRSDKPLIYKAVPSWFVRVEPLREKLIRNNQLTHWVPAAVKEKRFHNWLSEARDWCISRNRYWGTPIPLWTSEDFTQIVCIGSVAELQQYTKEPITDLHRHFVDSITIPDPRNTEDVTYPPLKRIDEVFDCWFESGSMPYAQLHYPFENRDAFANGFPADFVAEGLDQTRGWFYTLMVLSTALFDKPAFRNLIVNGLVLAADGKKMSKRLKNYPDPMDVIREHGADALRLFLVNSPVVKAESLRFREEGVREVVRDVLLPWYHAFRFFVQMTTRYEADTGERLRAASDADRIRTSTNIMDKWIFGAAQNLVKFVQDEMAGYRLYTVVPVLVRFLDNLTNWYVRLNRERMRGAQTEDRRSEDNRECCTALNVLFEVLFITVRLMSAFTPFITEVMYQNLKKLLPEEQQKPSVHQLMMPSPETDFIDETVEETMRLMQRIVICGRTLREKKKVSLKTPLKRMVLIYPNPELANALETVMPYLRDELNILDIEMKPLDRSVVSLSAVPNFKVLGARAGPAMPALCKAIQALTMEQIQTFEDSGTITVNGFALGREELAVKCQPAQGKGNGNILVECVDRFVVMLDFTEDAKLQQMALAREIANRVQKLRKQANLTAEDRVNMFVALNTPTLIEAFESQRPYIRQCLKRPVERVEDVSQFVSSNAVLHQELFSLNDQHTVQVLFTKMTDVSTA